MSGTRLPGDSESNDRHHDGEERFMTRLDGELRDRALAAADEHGSKAELVRAALADYLPDYHEGPRIKPPEDEELRKAFRTLQRLARHRGGRVPEDEAASAVAQELGVKAPTVRNGTLGALADEGYLIRERAVHGRPKVRVFMPEDAERLAAEIEDANGGEQ
jgi:hypothetical protein